MHFLLPYLGLVPHPVWGAIVAAILGSAIAQRYTTRVKRVDSTLEFNRQFHELMSENIFIKWPNSHRLSKDGAIAAAKRWWLKYFDLIGLQYEFYRHGFLFEGGFTEWMMWRQLEYNNGGLTSALTDIVSYKDGWEFWKNTSQTAKDTEFVKFLDSIHSASDDTEVKLIVMSHKKSKLSIYYRHKLQKYIRSRPKSLVVLPKSSLESIAVTSINGGRATQRSYWSLRF